MSKLKEKLTGGGMTTIVIIAILVLSYVVSWFATCGIIKLITMCFGLTFKWSVATGIWLLIFLLRLSFKSGNK